MNPAKTQFKIDLSEDFGRKFEKMEEEADHSFYRQEGARDALKAAAPLISGLMEHIDKEVQDGALAEIAGEPLKIAAYAKKWLKRVIGTIDGMATKAEVSRIAAGGKKAGLEDAKQYAFKIWKEERAKLEAFQKLLADEDTVGIEDGPPPPSPDGHPGPTLKSQRQAEEKKEPAPPPEPPAPAEPPPPPPEKKKRGPRKRTPKKVQQKASKPQTKAGARARAKAKGKG